jgi:hypothetical protein
MSLTEDKLYFYFPVCTKTPESRRQYPRRFKMFLDFLKFEVKR